MRVGPRHSRRGNSSLLRLLGGAPRDSPHQAPCPPKLTFGGRALGSQAAGSGRLFRITQFGRRSLLPAKEDLVRALLAEAQNHVLRASRRITSARCRFQTLDVCNRTGENNNMQRATSIIVGQGDIACPVLQAHFCCLQAAHKGRFTISSSTWCRSLKTVDRGVGVAAFVHEERLQHTKSCPPAGKLAGVDFTKQDTHFRPHVAIAHVRTPSHREKSDANFQPYDNHKTSCRRLTVCLNGALVNADVPFESAFLAAAGTSGNRSFCVGVRDAAPGGQKRADETSNRLIADLTSTKTSAA